MKKNKTKGKLKVEVLRGELQHFNNLQFKKILEDAAKRMGIKAEFSVKTERAAFRCFSCGYEWISKKRHLQTKKYKHNNHCYDHKHGQNELLTEIACPKCKSTDTEITKGLEVKIKQIILEKNRP